MYFGRGVKMPKISPPVKGWLLPRLPYLSLAVAPQTGTGAK